MASSTRQSLAVATKTLEGLLANADLKFAQELFGVAGALADSPQLRGALSDPSAESKSKAGAVQAVFGKAVSKQTIDLVTTLAELRWSKPSDLVVAFEQLAVFTAASIASKAGRIDQLESDIFAFSQAVASDQDLQLALSSRTAPVEAKEKLVVALSQGKVGEESALLIRQAAVASGKRRFARILESFAKLVAAYSERLIAQVTVATPLSADQAKRLSSALTATYGHGVKVNVEVDPAVLGGVRVQIAGEVLDGTIASRLNEARLQLA
jgi:F-type H+-transporting ATPase subunit delta